MPEEVTPSATAEVAPATAPTDVVPTDFREYVKWRTTGEPAPETIEEAPPAAAEAEAPQAKTVPDSETAEDQEAEEEETDEESSEEEPAGHKRPGSRQRKIDRLTREREEFARENEELKRRIAEREQPPPKKESAADGEPQLEQFATLQEYQRALALYFHEQARAEDRKAAAVAAAQEAWNGKEKAARKAHGDYDDVIDSFKVPEGPGVMAARHAMLEDPHGAEILYWLGKHKGDVARIASLDPVNAVREIGRLSVMFDSPSVPETAKRITSAPKLLPPVGRPAKTSSDSIYDEAVQQDFRRWEKARLAQLKG